MMPQALAMPLPYQTWITDAVTAEIVHAARLSRSRVSGRHDVSQWIKDMVEAVARRLLIAPCT